MVEERNAEQPNFIAVLFISQHISKRERTGYSVEQRREELHIVSSETWDR